MNNKYSPFLWSFQEDESRIKHATDGEDALTASVNEEHNAIIVKITYENSR